MDTVAQWFAEHLGSFISPEIVVLIVSMLPLIELRGGILVAAVLEIPTWRAVIFCVIGNIIPIPFILLFIKQIFAWLRPTKLFGPIVRKLEIRAMNKSDSIKKMEFIGLMLFVGVPLPGTGAWTGALIAALLEIDLKKASLSIFFGILIAATIMTLLSYGVLANIIG